MNLKSVVFLMLVLIPCCCSAQFQMINKNSLVLINNSTSVIRYELKRSAEASWLAYSIEEGTKITYKLKSGENLNIRLCTEDVEGQKCVSYLLERTKRYQVYWNFTHSRWDVTEIDE